MLQPICINDITVFPPPCLSPQRAYEIYRPAFTNIIEYAVNSRISGNIYEFGTFHGYTARTLAELMRQYRHQGELHLFDSWQGFPEMTGKDAGCPEVTMHDTWHQGDCTPMIPDAEHIIGGVLNAILPQKVKTHKGFYQDTLPSMEMEAASVVHIDCDLYESTVYVLKTLIEKSVLRQGTVVMFDDWNNNHASNLFGERAAIKDLEHIELEKWFSYGSSGMAFIVQMK